MTILQYTNNTSVISRLEAFSIFPLLVILLLVLPSSLIVSGVKSSREEGRAGHWKANKNKQGEGVLACVNVRFLKSRYSPVFPIDYNSSMKLVSAIFNQIFVFPPNDSPSKTMKTVFYFIKKARFILKIFTFL